MKGEFGGEERNGGRSRGQGRVGGKCEKVHGKSANLTDSQFSSRPALHKLYFQ